MLQRFLLIVSTLAVFVAPVGAQTRDAAHAAIGDDFVALVPSRVPCEQSGCTHEPRHLQVIPLTSEGAFSVAATIPLEVAEPVNDVLIHAHNVIVQFSNTYAAYAVSEGFRPQEIARFHLEDPAPFFGEYENLPVMWLEPLHAPTKLVIFGKQVRADIDLTTPGSWTPQPKPGESLLDESQLLRQVEHHRREQTWREPHVFTLTRAESQDEGEFYVDYLLARRDPHTGSVVELKLLDSFHFSRY